MLGLIELWLSNRENRRKGPMTIEFLLPKLLDLALKNRPQKKLSEKVMHQRVCTLIEKYVKKCVFPQNCEVDVNKCLTVLERVCMLGKKRISREFHAACISIIPKCVRACIRDDVMELSCALQYVDRASKPHIQVPLYLV